MGIEKEKCKARCKDGTSCLNKAKYNGYCKKHAKTKLKIKCKEVNENGKNKK